MAKKEEEKKVAESFEDLKDSPENADVDVKKDSKPTVKKDLKPSNKNEVLQISKAELDQLLKQAATQAADAVKKSIADGDESKYKPDIVKKIKRDLKLSRLDGKFIVGLKDINTDPYIKSPIYIENEYDEKRREYVCYWTLIFEDGSEKRLPQEYTLRHVGSYVATISKENKENASYFDGVAFRANEEGLPTDTKVDIEVIQEKVISYDVVVLDEKGTKLTVSPDVVNWK